MSPPAEVTGQSGRGSQPPQQRATLSPGQRPLTLGDRCGRRNRNRLHAV